MLGKVQGSGNAGLDETDPGTTLMGFVVQDGGCEGDKNGVEHVRGQGVNNGKKTCWRDPMASLAKRWVLVFIFYSFPNKIPQAEEH